MVCSQCKYCLCKKLLFDFLNNNYITDILNIQLLIPCSLHQSHWIVCKVCLREQKIIINDSHADVDFEHRRNAIEPLVRYIPLILRAIDYYGKTNTEMPPIEKTWDVERVDILNVPQQPDG